MLATHPRTIRTAAIVLGTLVIDMDTSTGTRRVMDLMHRFGYTLGNGIEVVSDFIVQSPCKLLPYLGQHVQHRTFENQWGDSTTVVYRFPGLVSTFDAFRWLRANGIEYRPTFCHHSYDCCANWYRHYPATVHHHKGHTLVTINWYRNV